MDILSPAPNRRSRKIAPVDRADEEISAEDLLNVEDERLRSRQLAEHESQNITSNDQRLSVSEKSISEHFQSCLQLAAENKITAKNAFNFKLIDLLPSMFGRKKPIKDFTEVSSSLDAGVKIYSCRVDNVHSDTLKMATSVCSGNKARDGDDDDEDAPNRILDEKRRVLRKTRKTTIASAKDIDRPRGNDQQNCSYGILTNENFVTSSAIFDGNKLGWHLNAALNFWQSEKPLACSHENVSVKLPSISDDVFICTTFHNFKFGDENTPIEFSGQEKSSTHPVLSVPFETDFEPNDEPVDDDFTFQNDDEDASELPDRDKFAESENHVACLSRMMSSSDFVAEISNLIASEKSDYRYFNFQKLQRKINTRNTEHWAPLGKKSTCEKRTKEEKKELIDFENATAKDEDLKVFKIRSDPTCTFTATTSREKFLITPITDFSVNKFFKLNVWRDMFVIPNANNIDENPYEVEEMIEDYDYDNPNDSQNFLPEHHEDDYRDEEENDVPADVHEAMEKTMFLRDNLVEIPNKVSKIQLPFMVKDKSVNMKELKSKIWTQIENEGMEVEAESKDGALCFSNICERLIFQEKDRDLSVPIMFNAILQLANDKNLALSPIDEGGDFVVTVDTENNNFADGS